MGAPALEDAPGGATRAVLAGSQLDAQGFAEKTDR
jgi:hypothetical protein